MTSVVPSPSRLSSWLLKTLSLAAPLALCLGLAACGGGGGGGGDDDDPADDVADDGDGGPDDGDDDGDGGTTVDSGVDSGPGFEQVPLIEGLTTLAGAGIVGTFDGDRDTALFNNPVNIVMTADGDLIVADFDNNLVRRVTPAGDVTTLNQPPEKTVFVRPFGILIVGDTLYVQTDGNSLGGAGPPGGALWRLPLAGGVPELVRDNIGRCRGLELLPDGQLVMADRQAHVVQLYDPVSNGLTPLAGTRDVNGFVDAPGAAARFFEPYDVKLLPDGTLLVADWGNHALRKIDLEGNVTTYSGNNDTPGSVDGPVATATWHNPKGLALDAAGTLYVTNTGSYEVRRIVADQVDTLAGDGDPGWKDDAAPLSGQLYGIEGVDVGTDGYLYIADGTVGDEKLPYHRVRRLTLPSK